MCVRPCATEFVYSDRSREMIVIAKFLETVESLSVLWRMCVCCGGGGIWGRLYGPMLYARYILVVYVLDTRLYNMCLCDMSIKRSIYVYTWMFDVYLYR